MLGQKLSCFLILAALASVGVFAQAFPDGSVAYWTPRSFDTVYPTATPPQEYASMDTTASSIPVAFAEFVPVEPGICYDEQQYLQESDQIFKLIQETSQRNLPAVKEEARRALLNQPFTDYLQVGYAIENGVTNTVVDGSWKPCTLGCIVKFTYRGETYNHVCINAICEEGQEPNTQTFCDSSIGNDVYYYHRTFWCEPTPQPYIRCGVGGRCTETPDGLRCRGYPVNSSSSSSSQGLEYALVAPKNPSQPIMVAAYKNGKLLAKKPISNLGGAAYVARHGPVDASQAESVAVSTGLVEFVKSLLSNPFAVARLRWAH